MTRRQRWLILPCAALAVLGAALFAAACGDDDSSGDSSGGSGSNSPTGQTGSDEQFVQDLCKASQKFSDSLEKAFSGPTPDDIGKAFETLFKSIGKPMEDFANDFKKMKPPKDLAQWHADASKQLSLAAKALKDGDFGSDALEKLNAANSDSPIPDMPKDINDRLSKIAEKTKECKEFDLFHSTD